jgi:hypothetical protein
MALQDALAGIFALYILSIMLYYGNKYMLKKPYQISSYITMFAYNIIMLRLLAADLLYIYQSAISLSAGDLLVLVVIAILIAAATVIGALIAFGFTPFAVFSMPPLILVTAIVVVWLFFLGGIIFTASLALKLLEFLCYVYTAFINPTTIILALAFAIMLVIYLIVKTAGEEYYRYYVGRANWEIAKALGIFLIIQAINLVLPFCIHA